MGHTTKSMVMAVLLIWAMAGGMGCGKKGPPLPPLALIPPAPIQLTYQLTADQVVLQWKLDPEFQKKARGTEMGVEIYTATRELAEETCKGCPLTFKKAAELPVIILAHREFLERGHRYFYRLRIRQGTDIFSDYSETVSFDFK